MNIGTAAYCHGMTDDRPYVIGTAVATMIATSAAVLLFANVSGSGLLMKSLYLLVIAASIASFLLGYAGMSGEPSRKESMILKGGEVCGLILGFVFVALFILVNLIHVRMP